jgi:hypothetical protein
MGGTDFLAQKNVWVPRLTHVPYSIGWNVMRCHGRQLQEGCSDTHLLQRLGCSPCIAVQLAEEAEVLAWFIQGTSLHGSCQPYLQVVPGFLTISQGWTLYILLRNIVPELMVMMVASRQMKFALRVAFLLQQCMGLVGGAPDTVQPSVTRDPYYIEVLTCVGVSILYAF